MRFEDLDIHPALRESLRRMRHHTPRPVQAAAIPPALEGRDVIGLAPTGTGKTAAYLLPMLQALLTGPPRRRGRAARGLVIVPTRELAIQVAKSAKALAGSTGLTACGVYGKVGMGPQVTALAHGIDLVVGTPGRLQELVKAGAIDLSAIEMVAVDEADRMMDLGFLPQVERLLRRTAADRQTFCFTATMPKPVEQLARRFMQGPVRVEVGRHTTPAGHVGQRVISVHNRDKVPLLLALLDARPPGGGALVFCRTRRRVGWVGEALRRHGIAVATLHGDRTQAQRLRALARLERGELSVLVATDVVARGLHLEPVRLVINYDVPLTAEDFVHRIGRAAHGGGVGEAITLLARVDLDRWGEVSRRLELEVTPETFAGFAADGPSAGGRRVARPTSVASGDEDADREPVARRSATAATAARSRRRGGGRGASRPIDKDQKPGGGVIRRKPKGG